MQQNIQGIPHPRGAVLHDIFSCVCVRSCICVPIEANPAEGYQAAGHQAANYIPPDTHHQPHGPKNTHLEFRELRLPCVEACSQKRDTSSDSAKLVGLSNEIQ